MALPDSVDWRTYGHVPPVENMRNCDASWAFVTAGYLRGHAYRKTGKKVTFSSQELIDCSKSYGNHGCKGGSVSNALKYAKDEGLNSSESYPYYARELGYCYSKDLGGRLSDGYTRLEGDVTALKAMIATTSPVPVTINGDCKGFKEYSGGIYHQDSTCPKVYNFSLLAVGYVDNVEEPYFILQNNLGTNWGIKGYIHISFKDFSFLAF